MEYGHLSVRFFLPSSSLILQEKLGIDYLLDIWKASEKGSHPSETPSLVERFDDFIQRKLQIYSKVKQYHPARAPPPAKKVLYSFI